jgi:hypothetical protein
MEKINFGLTLVKDAGNPSKDKTKKYLQKEHLEPADEQLQTIEKSINDITVQQKFFTYRKSRQNERIPLCLMVQRWSRSDRRVCTFRSQKLPSSSD